MGFGKYLGPVRGPVDAVRRHLRSRQSSGRSLDVQKQKDLWAVEIRSRVAECGPGLKVNGPSQVFGGDNVRLGENVNFNGMRIWGVGGVEIGNNFHSGIDCKILTVNHDYDGGTRIPYDETVVHRPVKIGDNVWFGHSVIVVPGAVIGEGAVIGAGAVVSGTIDRCGVAVGNPAKVVKYRDMDHYERLKSQGMFL